MELIQGILKTKYRYRLSVRKDQNRYSTASIFFDTSELKVLFLKRLNRIVLTFCLSGVLSPLGAETVKKTCSYN